MKLTLVRFYTDLVIKWQQKWVFLVSLAIKESYGRGEGHLLEEGGCLIFLPKG